MATRIYLPNTGAAVINPTFGTWTETTGADRIQAVTTRISSVMTNKVQAHTATAANSTFLSRQYVIGPLAGQTYAASTIKGTIRVLESAINDNLDAMRLLVRVVAPDANTFRGTIYGPTNGTVLEFNTTLRAKRLATGGATTQVVITEGDYLVIDIGTTATTGGTSLSDTISYGDDSATDLGDNETDTTALNPFVELAGNIKFLQRGFGLANALISGTFSTPIVDTFTRSVVDALGNANSGDTWVLNTGTSANADVNGSAATIITNSATAQVWDLAHSSVASGGTQIAFTIALDKVPAATSASIRINTQVGSSESPTILNSALTGRVTVNSSAQIIGTLLQSSASSSGNSSSVAYTANDVFNVLLHSIRQAGLLTVLFKAKIWKVGTTEPDWSLASGDAGTFFGPAGHVRLIADANSDAQQPFTWTIDSINITQAWPYVTANAQADIKAVNRGFGQAQAKIPPPPVSGLGQAQASILIVKPLYFTGTGGSIIEQELFYTRSFAMHSSPTGTSGGANVAPQYSEFLLYEYTTAPIVAGTYNLDLSLLKFIPNNITFSGTFSNYIRWEIYRTDSWRTPKQILASGQTRYIFDLNNIAQDSIINMGSVTFERADRLYLKLFFVPVALSSGVTSLVGILAPGDTTGSYLGLVPTLPIISTQVGQAAAKIVRPQGFGQAAASIRSSFKFGQAQAIIGSRRVGQAQAYIGRPQWVGQSQALINSTIHLGSGQAAARINRENMLVLYDDFDRIVPVGQLWGQAVTQQTWNMSGGTALNFIPTTIITDGYAFAPSRAMFADIGGLPGYEITGRVRQNTSSSFSAISLLLGNLWTISFNSTTRVILVANGSPKYASISRSFPFPSDLKVPTTRATIPTVASSWQARFRIRILINSSGNPSNTHTASVQFKIWNDEDTEPTTWSVDLVSSSGYEDYPSLSGIYLNPNDTNVSFDGVEVTALWNTSETRVYANAQASIIPAPIKQFAQAQAKIFGGFTAAYGQAQADIEQTYNQFAQAQADIKQNYIQFGQSQANIKQTYQVYAQAQADIKAVAYGLGQANADIKAISNSFGQSQADIKQTYNQFGQAQADVKQTYWGFGQAQATIRGTAFGQAQGTIKATVNQFGQAQSDIKATSNVFGQSQADIKQTYQAYGQSQADIKATGNGLGQAQADVKATSNGLGQAQAKINAFGVNGFGQANARLLGAIQQYGQAQAKIKAFGVTGCAQAQADIKATSRGYGQSQADVKATSNVFAQAQSDILATSNVFAQSQADIKAIGYGFGQSQSDIKAVGRGYGQSQADIKATSKIFSQAQADILATSNSFGQSQADIKATSYQSAQAQAKIKAFNVCGFGQTQADIKATSQAYGQANALISRLTSGYGQSQADIKATSQVYGQAQSDIKTINYSFGQSQADIKKTDTVSGNAQALIKTVVNNYGQAQADITQTYQSSAQAQAGILTNATQFAQAQTYIKITVSSTGQAEAFISKSAGYGQVQVFIRQEHQLKNLTISDRHSIVVSVSDRHTIITTNSDTKTMTLTLSDRAINLTLSDRIRISLTLDDRNY